MEGCTLVVFSTDPQRHGAAARAYVLSQHMVPGQRAGRGGCPSPQPVEVRRVRYDFAQLNRWHRRVQTLISMEGGSSSDIDEARNRIVLEFTDPAGAERARRSLPALGVPVEAVIVEAPERRLVTPSDTFSPESPRVGVRLAPRFWAASVRAGKGDKGRLTYVQGTACDAVEDYLQLRGAERGPLFIPVPRTA